MDVNLVQKSLYCSSISNDYVEVRGEIFLFHHGQLYHLRNVQIPSYTYSKLEYISAEVTRPLVLCENRIQRQGPWYCVKIVSRNRSETETFA